MKFPTYCTTVSNSDGVTRIVYHRTTVVRFDADDITLQDGGWQTVTTKRRMNQASEYFNLDFHVYQENFVWFVLWKGETLEYHDGMTLNRHRLHAEWVKVQPLPTGRAGNELTAHHDGP